MTKEQARIPKDFRTRLDEIDESLDVVVERVRDSLEIDGSNHPYDNVDRIRSIITQLPNGRNRRKRQKS